MRTGIVCHIWCDILIKDKPAFTGKAPAVTMTI